MKDGSAFIKHCPCPACGSSDANAIYTDGHTYCHVCNHYDKGDGSEPSSTKTKKGHRMADLIQGTVQALSKRLITEETCRKFGYSVGTYKGTPVQIAEYRDKDGAIVAQKLRTPSKDFSTLGEFGEVALFGSHLWAGGKKIVVTEGVPRNRYADTPTQTFEASPRRPLTGPWGASAEW